MDTPNIIFLEMDNIRYDHLSFSGYKKNITPNIDKFAQQNVFFTNAFSTSSWTLPSLTSQFTGKFPSFHKMMINAPFLKNMNNNRLESITLSQILSKFGYKTYIFGYLDLLRNIYKKGFIDYINFTQKQLDINLIKKINFDPLYFWSILRRIIYGFDKHAYYINKYVKKLIKNLIKNKSPFFIYINYANAHSPWHAPYKFRKKFEIKSKKNKNLKNLLGNTSITRDIKEKFVKLPWAYSKLFLYLINKLKLTKSDFKILISQYDAEIAYLDYIIGDLLNFLKKQIFYDNLLLIITSDHGESFGEHNLLSHGFHLYDHLIHIPLIIKFPWKIKRKINN
ncbi:MAG: sulfatase [Candidatus Helarchaeota archaeon]